MANDSVNGAAAWAYGVKPWFEQGLYLPVYSLNSTNRSATIDGFKIRELFVRPDARNHKLFYGLNFEFSVNALYWEPKRISSEFRPIVGLHVRHWDFIYNPIMDTEYTGGLKGLDFNPAARVAYRVNDTWTAAVEEYDGFGPLRSFLPSNQEFHETWAVVDRNSRVVSVETGVGVGWSGGADRLTLGRPELAFALDSEPGETTKARLFRRAFCGKPRKLYTDAFIRCVAAGSGKV
jgi:hypothetical protein